MAGEIPNDIQPKRRTTQEMRDQQNKRIIDYWKAGATDMDIRLALKLPRRTYQRRLNEIRRRHLNEILDQQTAEAKASCLKICEEKIRWLDMKAQQIITNDRERTADKIAAMALSRQYQMDIAKLTIDGPAAFRITENGFYRRDDGSAIRAFERSKLSESEQAATEPANPEAAF